MKLDLIDLKILKSLQNNSKITNIELSKVIGLSAAPTLGRVQKLEKAGVLKSYHAVINNTKLGLGFTALIHLSLVKQKTGAVASFLEQIQTIHEVQECLQLTGKFDYQLRVITNDIPSFEKILEEKLGLIEEIGQLQTSVVIAVKKNSRIAPLNYKKEIIL
ncbi:MAG: Lrp/AsnC family transcriptional regulator [Flavobacteriales bacterium]|jgi:DNA-binding Lrp family transcriptional regulator|nr:Lrp/AsnC family transcriptional regulator [Flavobacteriales bacterium]MDG1440284.1 Lrp/AsnC family transcriptional regulator [Flavobacteriales bacterium]MDG1797294.1 Lrp/AsnC family transcriptional regulator [Flavobacteriales bacterium]